MKKLLQKLLSVTVQLQKLEQKKEDCVNAQLEFENNFLTCELSFNRKYQKLIDLDFDLADKVSDLKKQICNIKSRIKRLEKKALLCN